MVSIFSLSKSEGLKAGSKRILFKISSARSGSAERDLKETLE